VLGHLPLVTDPNALVGAATADDAAVYRLRDDLAIVATVDFITPVVDDAYAWGAVAAANALSDIYAMGARPLFALNLVNWPRGTLPFTLLEEVIRGGAEKAREAEIPILGGHSVDDPEPKFGMVVIGTVHPDRVVTNAGARPGDLLVLTKPLGIGVITTAIKRGVAPPAVAAAAIASMARLNRAAGEAMVQVGASAATDITGFGLLGHLAEMARAAGLRARVHAASVPILEGAYALAVEGVVPGGTLRNRESLGDFVQWAGAVDEPTQLLLYDAQTSGGLLIAVPPERADALLAALDERDVPLVGVIGEFRAGRPAIEVA